MKVVLIDSATITLQLCNDVFLCMVNTVGRGPPWTETDEFCNVLEGLGSVEAARL